MVCALWATSLTSCSYSNYDLYHLDVSTSRSSVGFPLGMSSRTLYTSLIARTLKHLMSLHLDRKVITPISEGICYSTSNTIISAIPTVPVQMCEPADHCDLTGNTASSTSEIRRLAFCIVRLDSLNVDPTRVPPSRTKTLCSPFGRLIA